MITPNVLATRYASPAMRAIWSPEAKIVAERQLWLAVLQAQPDLGVDFGGDDADAVLADYARVLDSGRPGQHRRARAGHSARRQGPDRGVQRAGRARAHPQGHDQP